MKIVFLNPSSDADPFYMKLVRFARVAAEDLGVELQVLDGKRDLALMRRLALGLIEGNDRPDYLVLVNDRNLAAELLPQISGAGIKTFLVCEGFFIAEKLLLGKPREKYPTWLGGLLPDDEQVGRLLAETLIDAARAQQLVADDGLIHIVGLAGAYSAGSILRMNGLRKAVDQHADVVLDAVAPALWERQAAALLTPELLKLNHRASIIWSASDNMALGAAEALEATGRRPGSEILVGGIDWSPFALEKINSGVFTASFGGHFLDCAWSIVMLYDHYHGQDFGASMALSKYAALTKEHSSRYMLFFDESRWRDIKFSEFSKVVNPGLAEYEFGIDSILARL